ncbi:MAG: hypothetical protein U0527_12510 [Candidatus Eisenbacteria bacterium]
MQIPRSIRGLAALISLLVATAARGEIRVHDAEDVLLYSTTRALTGDLLFREASGSLVRLITSIDDPSISNRGDGRFHPIEAREVEAALASIPSGFQGELDVDIYLLPYPRANCLRSSADGHAIYLSPGVAASASGAEAAMLLTHELGHLVHDRFLPDADTAGWRRFLALHSVDGDARYSADAPHAFRPHELFAEDFRVLFGGELARGDGRVENPEIGLPADTPGVRAFFLEIAALSDPSSVASIEALRASFAVYPNPAPRGVQLTLAARADLPASSAAPAALLVDATGRVIDRPALIAQSNERWTLELPRGLAAGSYWLALEGRGGALPIQLLR